MEISEQLQNDIIALINEDYDNINDMESLKAFLNTKEGFEEVMRQEDLLHDVEMILPQVLQERMEREKKFIKIIADGVTEIVRRTGERLELQKQAMRELVIKIGSRVIIDMDKTAPGFQSQTHEPESVDEGEFTVEVTPGKFQDTIVISPKE